MPGGDGAESQGLHSRHRRPLGVRDGHLERVRTGRSHRATQRRGADRVQADPAPHEGEPDGALLIGGAQGDGVQCGIQQRRVQAEPGDGRLLRQRTSE